MSSCSCVMLLVINIVNQLCHLATAKAEKTGREFYLFPVSEASSYLGPAIDTYFGKITGFNGLLVHTR